MSSCGVFVKPRSQCGRDRHRAFLHAEPGAGIPPMLMAAAGAVHSLPQIPGGARPLHAVFTLTQTLAFLWDIEGDDESCLSRLGHRAVLGADYCFKPAGSGPPGDSLLRELVAPLEELTPDVFARLEAAIAPWRDPGALGAALEKQLDDALDAAHVSGRWGISWGSMCLVDTIWRMYELRFAQPDCNIQPIASVHPQLACNWWEWQVLVRQGMRRGVDAGKALSGERAAVVNQRAGLERSSKLFKGWM